MPCQTSSISPTSRPKAAASPVLARRAETPTRKAPLRNFSSAKRPLASSRSRKPASTCGNSRKDDALMRSTTSLHARRIGAAMIRPQERNGFRGVADIIARQAVQLRIDIAARGWSARCAGSAGARAGRRSRPRAPSRGRDRALSESSRSSSFSLALRARRIDQAIEKLRKALHQSPSSSKPTSASARPRRPILPI